MLIPIAPPAFDVALDIVYATAANLTGRPVYRRAAAFLHADAAAALGRAAALARAAGLGLRLYDAFRPVEAQWMLWQACPDPDYIADPRRGSNHSRGVAVDLTLDGPDGRPLDMGTGFDDMTARSHHGRTDLPPAVVRNRALLAGIMAASGFEPYAFEWWHYQVPGAGAYPLLSDRAAGTGLMAEQPPGP